jgi:hydroxyacylglutathione hydrolase
MFFQRIVTEGLDQHSYVIASGGEGIVVDPRRDAEVYIALAAQQQSTLRYVLETHRNEDLVTGSCELAARTGARILHGRGLPFEYGEFIEDGEDLGVGSLRLRALATPGHTLESMSYALVDTDSGEDAVIVFSGDALFVGEVGRTDLYGGDRRDELAGMLYDSIMKRLLPLGDGVILAPAHGGNSVCGLNILERKESTLGYERLHNPRLRGADRERFVEAKRQERMVVPPYFARMEAYNLEGPPVLGHLPVPEALGPAELMRLADQGAVVVDVRMPAAFAGGHLPGSLNIWAPGLSTYAGWVLPLDAPVLLVADKDTPIEPLVRALVRVGYDRLIGYMRGGFDAWLKAGRPFERTATLTASEAHELQGRGAVLVDVRNVEEWTDGVVPGALLLELAELERRLESVPRDRPVIAMCGLGHRGSVGASLLQRHGYAQVYNLLGGFTAWKAQGLPVQPGPDAAAISRIAFLADHQAVRPGR